MSAQAQRKITQTFEAEPSLTPYSSIPERVQRFFAANTGSVLTINSVDPGAMTMAHMSGRVPVHYRELDEDLLSLLRSAGFYVHEADGTIRKMDCCLYRQGLEERQHWRDEALRRQVMMDDPEAVLQAVEDAGRETEGKRSGRRIVFPAERAHLHPGQPGTILPSAEDFVAHDPGFEPDEED